MSFDINYYRAAKAARQSAGVPKYSDTSPTEANPEEDARVRAECNAAYYSPDAPALEPVTINVPEMEPEKAEVPPVDQEAAAAAVEAAVDAPTAPVSDTAETHSEV